MIDHVGNAEAFRIFGYRNWMNASRRDEED